MKTEKIQVNKSADRPDGIEVEIVQPETPLEEQVICYLMIGLLRDLKQREAIPYDLPDGFRVQHRSAGTFVLVGGGADSKYYEPPKPIAILGLRKVDARRLDLLHASAIRPVEQPPAAAPTEPATAEEAPATTA
jgi:hypothetical protein